MFRLLKLKPPHGWNAVGWELGIVTLGVLIALAAQEFVQSLHWRSEVRETRQALDAELSRDLAAFQYRLDQGDCITARAGELEKWAESFRSGAPLRLKHEIVTPPGFAIRTEVWGIVDSDIASHIPLKDRLDYSGLYSSMKSFNEVQTEEGNAWGELAEYQASDKLGEADIRKVVTIAKALTTSSGDLPSWNTTVSRLAREIGLKPDPMLVKTANPSIARRQTAACEPYL